MSGFGLGAYGMGIPYGSVVAGGPQDYRSLGDFDFSAVSRSEGYKIRITFTIPAIADAPQWIRRLRILRKTGEWPQSWDDADAQEVIDDYFFTEATHYIDQDELVPRQTYYYSLFALRDDGTWVNDKIYNRDSAYPYDRWGSGLNMFDSLPRGWRSADADESGNPLENFMAIFGALSDNIKTDCEALLDLFDIDELHDDLVYIQDKRIGWPTWYAAGGLKRKKETKEAVDLYKLLGREVAYEQMLEEVSGWDASIEEGWKYIMWSTDLECTTPDTTLPGIITDQGTQDDLLKYTNDNNSWHSANGLGLFMSEILTVSDDLSQEMVDRFEELLDWGKAGFVTADLIVSPKTEEIWYSNWVIEDWDDVIS